MHKTDAAFCAQTILPAVVCPGHNACIFPPSSSLSISPEPFRQTGRAGNCLCLFQNSFIPVFSKNVSSRKVSQIGLLLFMVHFHGIPFPRCVPPAIMSALFASCCFPNSSQSFFRQTGRARTFCFRYEFLCLPLRSFQTKFLRQPDRPNVPALFAKSLSWEIY